MALLTLVLMTAGAVGGGAALLRALGIDKTMSLAAHLTWAFVLGIGVLGFIIFFFALAHAVSPFALSLACAAGLPGLALLRQRLRSLNVPSLRWPDLILLAGILIALAFDVLEGMSPPGDADSLAYHFAVPKLFLEAGGLFFIPRANDGAVPMLQQMTYLAALGIGGERAMTLWTMLSGWSASAATFLVARRMVGRSWALAATLAFISLPAVIYGAGSGQVETRNAAFVLLAAVAAVQARQAGDLRYAALAGIAAGFYASSKYPGLLFVFSCALLLLFQRRWAMCLTVYALAASVAGGQWYFWNAWMTADPFFPMLHGWIPYHDGANWNAAQRAFYSNAFQKAEKPLQPSLLLLLLYPFQATLSGLAAFDAKLIGFGPLLLLLMPAILIGVWCQRQSLRTTPLTGMAVVCFVAYALWLLFGPSLRLRFHLPLYPLLLICGVAAAERATRVLPALKLPVMFAFVATFMLQGAAHAAFTVNYARHVFSGEDRTDFLARNVSFYAGAEWLNEHLRRDERVAIFHRELNYLLNVPYFYVNSVVDGRIDVRLGPQDLQKLWDQLRQQKITHVLADLARIEEPPDNDIDAALRALRANGCVVVVAEIPTQRIASRTLSGGRGVSATAAILKLVPEACALEARPAK